MVSLIAVTPDTVEKTGFFCKMSGRKTPGYQRKLAWLRQRFDEGLEIAMLGDGERGFIETMPGERCWRAIEAKDYLAIHCLWVVGRSKGKGHSATLLDHAEGRARADGFKGVCALTSTGNWLVGPQVLEKRGYRVVAREEPFQLMAKALDDGAGAPALCGGYAEKSAAAGPGFTVFESDQCPYLADAVATIEAHAGETGQPFRIVRLETADDVRSRSPSPYGVYSVVKDGKLFSYHYLLAREIAGRTPG